MKDSSGSKKLGMAMRPPRHSQTKHAYEPAGEDGPGSGRLCQAREIFEREKNLVWPWLIDLVSSLLLFHEGKVL